MGVLWTSENRMLRKIFGSKRGASNRRIEKIV
jgi:hypothetical protein